MKTRPQDFFYYCFFFFFTVFIIHSPFSVSICSQLYTLHFFSLWEKLRWNTFCLALYMNSSCISVSFPFKGQVHTSLKGLMSQLSTVKEAGLECWVQMLLLCQKE